MTLARILVHADDSPQAKQRIEAALALASTNDAHLTGAAIELRPAIPTYAMAHMPSEAYAALAEEQQSRVAEARSIFQACVESAGWEARTDFKTARGDIARSLAHFGRMADLIVISQAVEGTDTEELPDNLVLESGAPVLVLPTLGLGRRPIGEKVLVAWRDTRESARVVRDSLPLLAAAKEIEVTTVADEDETVELSEIAAHLAAHGITATVNRQSSGEIPAEAIILNRASDGGFDSIVCGGYGHSRFRETVLGGVTRELLRSCPVPVLMSH